MAGILRSITQRGLSVFAKLGAVGALSTLGAGALLLAGCSKQLSKDLGGTVRMQVPLQDNRGDYHLEQVELRQLESLRSMRGDYAEFFLSPKIQEGSLSGSEFSGRFAKMGDLWVARDVISLTAATIYYHLQKLTDLDVQVGAAGLKRKRQQVALSAMLIDPNGTSSPLKNTALFEATSRALLFVAYTEKQLPIAINSGILAHEYFHALFYPLVLEPLIANGFLSDEQTKRTELGGHKLDQAKKMKAVDANEAKPVLPENTDREVRKRLIHHFLWLKAINEGLADVWGWAYTGDPDFIALSLPSEKITRTLSTASVISFTESSQQNSKVAMIAGLPMRDQAGWITKFGYEIGTEWARFFKSYVEKSQLPREKVLAKILANLADMKKGLLEIQSNTPTEKYDIKHFLLNFSKIQENQSAEACQLVVDSLKSLAPSTKYECKEVDQVLIQGGGFQPHVITEVAPTEVAVDQEELAPGIANDR